MMKEKKYTPPIRRYSSQKWQGMTQKELRNAIDTFYRENLVGKTMMNLHKRITIHFNNKGNLTCEAQLDEANASNATNKNRNSGHKKLTCKACNASYENRSSRHKKLKVVVSEKLEICFLHVLHFQLSTFQLSTN